MDLLQVRDVTFRYPTSGEAVLNGMSFRIKKGEFVVLCGETGCGKTTLLRLIKNELAPHGERKGRIYFSGKDIEESEDNEITQNIGFVMQRPETQIVTDTVWHELAFGLENMGLSTSLIRRRVGEMASYFGIGDWFDKKTSELSGGQKQLLNLAAVMVMQPELLILDEPTAQLDPIAAADFIATLQKLNREFGLTILLSEHRLEDVFPVADRIMVMGEGRLLCYDTPGNVGTFMNQNDKLRLSMPCAMRVFHAFDFTEKSPVTVKEGRTFIEDHFDRKIINLRREDRKSLPMQTKGSEEANKESVRKLRSKSYGTPALSFHEVSFRHQRDEDDVLRYTSFSVFENEIYCILGGNASGKSTTLRVAAGVLHPYSGKVNLFGKRLSSYKAGSLYKNNLAMLPQDVQTVFIKNTVREELGKDYKQPQGLDFDFTKLMDKHPYDLSGGEQQLCALAKVLQQEPRVLLLDEPTKGIDSYYKAKMINIIRHLKQEGMTILIVTHDLEFAAHCADRCALFFNGEITSEDAPWEFFEGNNFYTTAANRMTRNLYEKIITVEDAIEICRLNQRDDS